MLNMVYAVYDYMLYESASCPLINTVMVCALQTVDSHVWCCVFSLIHVCAVGHVYQGLLSRLKATSIGCMMLLNAVDRLESIVSLVLESAFEVTVVLRAS